MKKLITIITTLAIALTTPVNVSAQTANNCNFDSQIVYLENGDYLETTIHSANTAVSFSATNSLSRAAKQITKTKTSTYKSADGKSLWSVSITGTFTYNGSTSKCISCSHSAKAYVKNWSIKSVSSSKNGNSATANAVAIHTVNGSNTIKKQVTITCSKNGTIS